MSFPAFRISRCVLVYILRHIRMSAKGVLQNSLARRPAGGSATPGARQYLRAGPWSSEAFVLPAVGLHARQETCTEHRQGKRHDLGQRWGMILAKSVAFVVVIRPFGCGFRYVRLTIVADPCLLCLSLNLMHLYRLPHVRVDA